MCRKIGRYDWGMNGDVDTECLFFHFVEKVSTSFFSPLCHSSFFYASSPSSSSLFVYYCWQEKAQELVRGHNALGEDFWDEAYDKDLSGMTQIWSDTEGIKNKQIQKKNIYIYINE